MIMMLYSWVSSCQRLGRHLGMHIPRFHTFPKLEIHAAISEYAAANTCGKACTRCAYCKVSAQKKKCQLILSYGQVGSQRALGCNFGEGHTYTWQSFAGFYGERRVVGLSV